MDINKILGNKSSSRFNKVLNSKTTPFKRTVRRQDSEIINDLKFTLSDIKEKAGAIIKECDKWQNNPSAVFRHGYADEKAQSILNSLERGRRRL